jgi:hypothetical protein
VGTKPAEDGKAITHRFSRMPDADPPLPDAPADDVHPVKQVTHLDGYCNRAWRGS